MKFLLKLSSWIDELNEQIGRLVSWLTTVLVLLVFYDVVRRYVLSDTETWIMELEWHLFALIFLFGAGYALKHDRHVRVDLFYAKFSERDKALVNFIGGILFLVPWCVLIIYASWKYAFESFLIRETSPDPGGLPALYLIKFAIVFGVFLLLLQSISELIKSLSVLTNHPSRENELNEEPRQS